MTFPENPLDQVKVPVGTQVYTAAKAVAASIPLVLAVVALFVTDVADGSISGAEAWKLVGAVVAAATAVVGVFQTENKPKN